MQVILLERIEKLGTMGDVVTVKPGFARNFLLPQQKALRATKDNIAYFETQRKSLEKDNENRRKDAEKLSGKLDDATFALIRQASDGGQLYGSVTARDIAQSIADAGHAVDKKHVIIDRNFKMLGLYPVRIKLHPEVVVTVTINIARSAEEAKMQEERGEAMVATDNEVDLAQQAVEAVIAEEEAEKAEAEAAEAEATEAAVEAEAQEDTAQEAEKATA